MSAVQCSKYWGLADGWSVVLDLCSVWARFYNTNDPVCSKHTCSMALWTPCHVLSVQTWKISSWYQTALSALMLILNMIEMYHQTKVSPESINFFLLCLTPQSQNPIKWFVCLNKERFARSLACLFNSMCTRQCIWCPVNLTLSTSHFFFY